MAAQFPAPETVIVKWCNFKSPLCPVAAQSTEISKQIERKSIIKSAITVGGGEIRAPLCKQVSNEYFCCVSDHVKHLMQLDWPADRKCKGAWVERQTDRGKRSRYERKDNHEMKKNWMRAVKNRVRKMRQKETKRGPETNWWTKVKSETRLQMDLMVCFPSVY